MFSSNLHLGLPSVLFPSGFSANNVHALLISSLIYLSKTTNHENPLVMQLSRFYILIYFQAFSNILVFCSRTHESDNNRYILVFLVFSFLLAFQPIRYMHSLCLIYLSKTIKHEKPLVMQLSRFYILIYFRAFSNIFCSRIHEIDNNRYILVFLVFSFLLAFQQIMYMHSSSHLWYTCRRLITKTPSLCNYLVSIY
jgi:hypothetical protein